MKTILALWIILFSFALASAQNEQSPLQEREITYKDWTYKSVNDDKIINLREYTGGKKLVLVVYFAPWCPNWKHEAPFAEKLYKKYQDKGLGVVGVGEYDTVEAMKINIADQKITFPVVYESDSKAAKRETLHYKYRKTTGDTRGWGSPWNIFLEPAKLSKNGDILTEKTFIVNGELIETDVEKFVREKLGLSAEELKDNKMASQTVEACEPEKKAALFKKP